MLLDRFFDTAIGVGVGSGEVALCLEVGSVTTMVVCNSRHGSNGNITPYPRSNGVHRGARLHTGALTRTATAPAMTRLR